MKEKNEKIVMLTRKKYKGGDINTLVAIGYDREKEEIVKAIDFEGIREFYSEGHEIDFVEKLTELIDVFVRGYVERLIEREVKKGEKK